MVMSWEQVVVQATDPQTLGRWWATALDWAVVADEPDEVEIQPEAGTTPGLIFVPAPGAKTGHNRLHLDFRPIDTDADQDAEVERLLALGATRADIGQGGAPWVVLSDPEGNEFCVLSARVS